MPAAVTDVFLMNSLRFMCMIYMFKDNYNSRLAVKNQQSDPDGFEFPELLTTFDHSA